MKIIPDDLNNPFNFTIDYINKRFADIALFDKAPDIVCFDLFGTIIDSLESDKATLRKIIGYDIVFPLKNGKSLWNSFGDLVGEENAEIAKRNYILGLTANIADGSAKPFPAIDAVLSYLFALGSKIVIVTNRDFSAIAPLFAKYPEIFNLVSAIGYSKNENLPSKPDPQSFIKTLNKAGLKPTKNMIMIGDATGDITYARNCGMTPVMFGFNMDHQTPQYQRENKDIFLLPDYELLARVLETKFKNGYNEYVEKFNEQGKKHWKLNSDEILITGLTQYGYTNNQITRIFPNGKHFLQNIKENMIIREKMQKQYE
ncbi:MAG: HAD-IA family hydrolase [Rickettsiales bacterium]|jgi:phosphoglycolate phosphatase-like HAD superfamily hydrolase|nr:HAD-IA family hydrolase [Rickettsiales bacterium]